MNIIPYAEEVCSVLDQLALPRAFVHSKVDRFVAWNPHFLNTLNIGEDEIKTLAASEVLCFEDGIEFDDGLWMVSCSGHLLAGSRSPVNGHAIVVPGALTFVMLDVAAPARQVFQSSLTPAVEEERTRLYRFLHDQMSPRLMAVALLAESLAGRLENAQPKVAEEAATIRRLLGDVFDKMHLLFAPPLVPTKSHGSARRGGTGR